MAIKQVALAALVEDFELYPRNQVDSTHIGDLLSALKAGQELPPIVADKKTLRIVDGFHRRRAMLKHLGEDGKVGVELRSYKSDAELFLDAVNLNAAHGRKLDRHDQTRIVRRLRDMRVDDHTIALTLHIPEAVVQTLFVRVVLDPNGNAMPSKRGFRHLQGMSMNAEQVKVIGSVRSGEVGRICLELSGLIDAGLVDLSNQQIVERLRMLSASLEAVLRTLAA